MGAGCSGSNAAKVQSTIKALELSPDAKKQLKLIADKEKERQKGRANPNLNIEDSIEDLNKELLTHSKEYIYIPNYFLRQKNKKLWEAIETNDIKTVQFLLNHYSEEQFSNSDIYDPTSGQSMIHKAASLGHAEILMLFLERTGVKADLVNSQLATPLHLACKNNRESVAKFLIGCGVDVNAQDEHGQTPLLICCIHGHIEIAQLLVESSIAGHTPEPLEVDMKDHRGLTPLNCSAIKGDIKFTKLLIERGGAKVEESSPKGCTPLLYAARGGYSDVVRYLLEKGASPMKQDNAGGTVLHHAIEKSHLEVLQVLVEYGVDVYSAIEICDNAGRTPVFEAIDNNVDGDLLQFLIKKKSKGGFGAQVNVINYSGQTPLFGAVRENNYENVRILIEIGGAKVDLCGAQTKLEEEEDEEQYDSLEEKFFMEAFKNAMTPLQLACILGHDEIIHFLVANGANPNKQTSIKGYNCLHLSILANKPEIIIELLTKTNANHNMPDYSGRTLTDMIEKFIPMIENLQVERIKRAEAEAQVVVATHYYNPDDERQIKGAHDLEKPEQIYQDEESEKKEEEQIVRSKQGQQSEDQGANSNPHKQFLELDESEIEIEEGKPYEKIIELVFGKKIALGLIASNWKFKEISIKIIFKQTEKFLSQVQEGQYSSKSQVYEHIRACTVAIDLMSKEKVIKVFTICLQLLSLIIGSNSVETTGAVEVFKDAFIDRNIVSKLLLKGEEGNTRLTNKIHEILLDFSFHPKIGEAHISSFILQRIQSHNKVGIKANQGAQSSGIEEENQENDTSPQKQTQQELTLGSYKGLLSQLALLYKFVNSFGVSVKKRGPLNVKDIVNSILPALTHQSQDVRNASTKILLDVQRLTGCVKEDLLNNLNDKVKQLLLEKLSQVKVEKRETKQQEDPDTVLEQSIDESQSSNLPQPGAESVPSDLKEKIAEKGTSKDWTEREIALKQMKETFQSSSKKVLQDEELLTNCTVLLKSCLEDNNITLYIEAIEAASIFFSKALQSEIVLGSLQTLIKAIVLHTTDMNTRARKRSIDVIYQVWNSQVMTSSQNRGNEEKKETISSQIAEVICDQSLQEKAIIGRLGLMIKRIASVEDSNELSSKAHQMIIGKNYEQVMEFACQWVTHKNTKVRQNALKLIIELCRLNSIDPRGTPFKQRIINYILGLRPSVRGPLVQKINEICSSQINTENENQDNQPYIDVNELELNVATKTRSVSQDIRKKQNSASKKNSLPDIPQSSGLGLPQVNLAGSSNPNQPTLVLPHSEPLSEEQKQKYQSLIELFNLEIITCFLSQTWSTRQAAIEKVSEQLSNLDPSRRDAMSTEINKQNLPVEQNFTTFIEFITEGIKDPNLKNYLAILELTQKSLPIFFRHIQQAQIKKEIMPLVSHILKKTTDLKAKVREASLNFCLYLSHQSPIGPEAMITQVLSELEQVFATQQSNNVAANLGNSHMISSGIQLLNQFQSQTQILQKEKTNLQLFQRFMQIINQALKHQNPNIRKEAESFFKLLYKEFGEKLDKELKGQKQQLVQKLISEAKQESGGQSNEEKQQELNLQRASSQVKDEVINQQALKNLLKDQQENLNNLKLPNPKKRLKSIIEIKKAIQRELVGVNAKTARELFEPLTMLIRQILGDESPEIYLEALNLLKFVVSSISTHLGTLDLHLMMGQFLSVIVNNTVSGNMRIQIASDKVIIFFAKHNNIGPAVVARDILKNIEKINKAIQMSKKEEQVSVLLEKRPTLLRFLNLLQLLLQHFSIVLCYQQEFYDKCIEQLADSLLSASPQDEQSIKSLCTQLIMNLHTIDAKILEQSISKLDFTRKTPMKKIMIEMEHHQRQGKSIITQDHHSFVAQIQQESPKQSVGGKNHDPARDSVVSSSRTSLFSPGSSMYNAGGSSLDSSQYEWSRRNIEKQQSNNPSYLPSAEKRVPRRASVDAGLRGRNAGNVLQSMTYQKTTTEHEEDIEKVAITLPDIHQSSFQRYSNKTPSMNAVGSNAPTKQMTSINATGGAGFSSSNTNTSRGLRTFQSSENTNILGNIVGMPLGGSSIRPPLYVPQKRETGRSGQGHTGAVLPPASGPVKQNSDTFKTEFNSNLRTGPINILGQSQTNTDPSKELAFNNERKRSQQRDLVAPTGLGGSVFKPQLPQGFSFETNVTKYKEKPVKSQIENESKDNQ